MTFASNGAERTSEARNDPTPQRKNGDTVTVVGLAEFERDPSGVPDGSSYRQAPQRAVIAAPLGGYLLASEDPALVGVAGALRR